MAYILGFIILVLAFLAVGYFFKKKRYKDVDQLEEWKLKIMNRPVLDELSKVKQLNMTGETEEMFEKWRNEWDEIVTVRLPDVEELLFDAEEFIDKYRFSQSKEVQRKISQQLKDVEASIQQIIDELNELVGSEESNRVEIEELKEEYRVSKKGLLAHRHQYGRGAAILEHTLEETLSLFSQYEEATENGNYLQAREFVLKIRSCMKDVRDRMNRMPDLLTEANTVLPNQLNELKDGFAEMLEKEYILDAIEFSKEMDGMEKQLAQCAELLDMAEVEQAEHGLDELKGRISTLYDLFENEVVSRQYVASESEKVKDDLSIATYENDKLKMDTNTIKHSYHISENDIKHQKNLEKQLSSIVKQAEYLQAKINQRDTAYSLLADQLRDIQQKLAEITKEQKAYSQTIHDLRKDELEARSQIKKLHADMKQAKRWLVKSNVPGVPEAYKQKLAEAVEALSDVSDKLEETPLDMAAVNIYMEKAHSSVEGFVQYSHDMIEEMLLSEKVIQYANRYRSKYPSIGLSLQEAEAKFRQYEYSAALEEAAAALEKVDPGSLKEIKVQKSYLDELD
ncbi:septation ring formation regulator EzrA [Bacillus testis]|uniref:septation ring formation regulator EzrA n=1 Tax=Bacillus testis TaxID=1622072 RepID=UPI00067E9182|nr:septation ring formation regulator EzrA [Bacillus testis]